MARSRRVRNRYIVAPPKMDAISSERKGYRPGSVDALPVGEGWQDSEYTKADHRLSYTPKMQRQGVNARQQAQARYRAMKEGGLI